MKFHLSSSRTTALTSFTRGATVYHCLLQIWTLFGIRSLVSQTIQALQTNLWIYIVRYLPLTARGKLKLQASSFNSIFRSHPREPKLRSGLPTKTATPVWMTKLTQWLYLVTAPVSLEKSIAICQCVRSFPPPTRIDCSRSGGFRAMAL